MSRNIAPCTRRSTRYILEDIVLVASTEYLLRDLVKGCSLAATTLGLMSRDYYTLLGGSKSFGYHEENFTLPKATIESYPILEHNFQAAPPSAPPTLR
jgi:hypothetical protein